MNVRIKHPFIALFLLLSGLFCSFAIRAQTASFDHTISEHRSEYKAHFLNDARSPLSAADTAYLDFFAPDENWRLKTVFERTPQEKPFEMRTYSGQKREYVKFGQVQFFVRGQKQTLNVYQNLRLLQDSTYRDYLFLPFKDVSNGEETYGGGRYLDFKQADIQADNTLVLDFNRCYNPWCAFSDGYNCPIPPMENHLEILIPAGEKNFREEKKH